MQTKFVGMMQYDGDLKLPARFLVPPPAISGVSGELLAKEGVTTFACSETQKFGHVRGALLPSAALGCKLFTMAARMNLWQAVPKSDIHHPPDQSHRPPLEKDCSSGADRMTHCRR